MCLRILSILLISLSSLSSAFADVSWKVCPIRSKVSFSVSHFVLMEVTGAFSKPEGVLVTKTDNDFSASKLSAVVPVGTVDTGNLDRDDHLKTDVFFDAEKFPEMKLISKNVTRITDSEYEMLADLSIRGVTRPVKFLVKDLGKSTSKSGITRAKFHAQAVVSRYQFGLKWNELTEAGKMVVGENVNIDLDVTLEKVGTQLASK